MKPMNDKETTLFAAIMKEFRTIVAGCGYELPILCTPEELLGD